MVVNALSLLQPDDWMVLCVPSCRQGAELEALRCDLGQTRARLDQVRLELQQNLQENQKKSSQVASLSYHQHHHHHQSTDLFLIFLIFYCCYKLVGSP